MTSAFKRSLPGVWLGLVLLAGIAGPDEAQAQAQAQDRMPPIAVEDMTDAQRAAAEELAQVRGIALRGPWIPLLRSPEVLRRARAMGDYLRYDSVLPPRLSEFLILLTAREWTQQYEWAAHAAIALEAGVEPAVVQAIAEGRRPAQLAEDEAALYALHSELLRNHGLSDASYADALRLFGEQGIVDAVGIIGYYSLLAMVMNVARTPAPGGMQPPLQAFP
jgi:4-carboxymuconolactone decarboxylase